MNITIAFYFVTECSDVQCFSFEGVSCNNTFVLYLALTNVGLNDLLWKLCCAKCYGLAKIVLRKCL